MRDALGTALAGFLLLTLWVGFIAIIPPTFPDVVKNVVNLAVVILGVVIIFGIFDNGGY